MSANQTIEIVSPQSISVALSSVEIGVSLNSSSSSPATVELFVGESPISIELSLAQIIVSNFTSAAVNTVSISGNITLDNDFINASGTITLTLPTAIGNSGKIFYVRNAGSGVITINTTGSQNINGYANFVLQFSNSVLGLISDGSNWNIL